MAAMTLIVILARNVIPLLFLGLGTRRRRRHAALAAILLVVGASFFIADGVQTVAAGALRGLNDTRMPLCSPRSASGRSASSPAIVFGFTLGYGAAGIWIGLSIGLAVYALLLVWRFHSLTRRGYLPEIVTSA